MSEKKKRVKRKKIIKKSTKKIFQLQQRNTPDSGIQLATIQQSSKPPSLQYAAHPAPEQIYI